jgi:hypothetical protein
VVPALRGLATAVLGAGGSVDGGALAEQLTRLLASSSQQPPQPTAPPRSHKGKGSSEQRFVLSATADRREQLYARLMADGVLSSDSPYVQLSSARSHWLTGADGGGPLQPWYERLKAQNKAASTTAPSRVHAW